MRIPISGLDLSNPSLLSLLSQVSYWGVTSANGNIGGTTLVCADLANHADYSGQKIVVLDTNAAGQPRRIVTDVAGVITVANAFTNNIGANVQITAGVRFVILSTPTEALVTSDVLHEQADVAVNTTAPNAPAENNVLNLAVAGTRYLVRHLRLKSANPGVNTVTVRLYELQNDVLTEVDSFAITAANFATFHSLMDMFGLPYLAGDQLQVTVQASAGGPFVVTGQMSWTQAT